MTCIIDAKRSGEELTTAGLCRAAARTQQSEDAPAAQSEPGAGDAVERQLDALERAWAEADDTARRLFMEKHRTERERPAPRPVVRLAASNTGFSSP